MDQVSDSQISESKIIGVATRRIDGPLKVSGGAMYASDHNFPGPPLCVAGLRHHCERLNRAPSTPRRLRR